MAERPLTPRSNRGGIRYLVVHNTSDTAFRGVAVLHADYRTRHIAPVIVTDPDRTVVPSRIVNEVLGEVESDGKRRWCFDLEFFCDCDPSAIVAYVARFGDDPASKAPEEDWHWRRKEGLLPAIEHDELPTSP